MAPELESYEAYLEAQENSGKMPSKLVSNFFGKLDFIHYVLLIGLVLIINRMVKQGGNNKWAFIIIGVIVLIWILSLMGKNQDRKPIPRHIAEKIALNDLQRLIDLNSAYPHGTRPIHTGKFKAHHMDSGDPRGWGLDKYNFGFKIQRPGKSDLHVIYQMNPYPPGDCQGIIEQSREWEGDDVKDFQIIVPERTIIEEKKEPPK